MSHMDELRQMFPELGTELWPAILAATFPPACQTCGGTGAINCGDPDCAPDCSPCHDCPTIAPFWKFELTGLEHRYRLQAMTEEEYPPVMLPGSEYWWSGWEFGDELAKRFPDAEAHDFGTACGENPSAETVRMREHGVLWLECEQVGERDEGSWIWNVVFGDGSSWRVEGWCDYTGWDCQSGMSWERL